MNPANKDVLALVDELESRARRYLTVWLATRVQPHVTDNGSIARDFTHDLKVVDEYLRTGVVSSDT